jgi:hypothetical protein
MEGREDALSPLRFCPAWAIIPPLKGDVGEGTFSHHRAYSAVRLNGGLLGEDRGIFISTRSLNLAGTSVVDDTVRERYNEAGS